MATWTSFFLFVAVILLILAVILAIWEFVTYGGEIVPGEIRTQSRLTSLLLFSIAFAVVAFVLQSMEMRALVAIE